LHPTVGDLAGTPFQFVGPSGGDVLLGFFQAGEQFFRDASTLTPREAKRLSKQLVRRHKPKFNIVQMTRAVDLIRLTTGAEPRAGGDMIIRTAGATAPAPVRRHQFQAAD
jgi:hypothetical protein